MSLARDITTVGGGTLTSRLLAYARDAVIAALLGSGPFAEAFFAVLQVVNFFRRLLAEGALNSAFVPIWLRLAGGEDGAANANRFTIRTLVTVGCVTGAAALFVVVFARLIIAVIAHGFSDQLQQLTAYYLMIVAPYIVLAGLIAVVSAALNAEGRVAAVTVSTVIFNLVLVGVLVYVIVYPVLPYLVTLWLSFAIVAAGFIQLSITAAVWFAGGRRFARVRARAHVQNGPFFSRALPGLIAAGTPQLKLIAATGLVSSSPAAVSWLYYANRLYELPLGVASIAIAAVIVPRVARTVHAGDRGAYVHAQSRAFELALGLALPAATGFALLAPQIASGLFEHGNFSAADTDAVATALIAICSGLPAHVMEKVFGAVSFAHEDTKTPMKVALTGLAVAVVAAIVLYEPFGYIGVAAAIAISAWVAAILLGTVLYRRGWLHIDGTALGRLPRIAAATASMGVAVAAGLVLQFWLLPDFPASALGRLLDLGVLVLLGVAVYAAAIDRLGVAKIAELTTALREAG